MNFVIFGNRVDYLNILDDICFLFLSFLLIRINFILIIRIISRFFTINFSY